MLVPALAYHDTPCALAGRHFRIQSAHKSSNFITYIILMAIVSAIDLQAKIDAANRSVSSTLAMEEWKSIMVLTIADIVAVCIAGEGDEK